MSSKKKRPRVLYYDIETSPNLAFIWGKYEQNALGDFVKERQIICFAWKWQDQKRVHVMSLPMCESYKKNPDDNKELIKKLHELMSEADIVVGHNVDKFDDKMVNTEFLYHGFPPPPPHKTVDTLKVARKYFRFNSNKLDDLGDRLGLGKKLPHGGFEMWAGCLRDDRKAWKLMEQYNARDVDLLEKVYLKLLPWMTTHPDMNSLDGLDACPNCKSRKLQSRGRTIVGGGYRQRYQCQNCGRWCRGLYKAKQMKWKFS